MASLLQFDELIKGTKGKALSHKSDCYFTSVQTDSRNVSENTLFVPLIGEVQNGHKYIPSAIEKGASVIFISENEYNSDVSKYDEMADKNKNVLFIVVGNTLHALQDAAETYVTKKCKDMIRVSITGSSGKTTTKEMMVSVCKAHFGENNVAYTKGNFNSETGLPLTAFNIRGDEKICILEMGMNRVNEIGEISKILKSQYGIITNIGTAHIGILGSRKNIAKEKRKSLDYIPADGAAFVWNGDDLGDFCCENVKGEIVKFGTDVAESVSGVKFIKDNGLFGSDFTVDGELVKLPLSGEYNYLNSLAVIACAKKLGITASEIKKGLENVSAVSGRMEVKETVLKNNKKVALIKDCYNANLDSMMKVIGFCNNLENVGKKIYILADMKELGAESEKSHRSIGEMLKDNPPDYVFLIGCEMKYAFEVIKNNKNVFLYNESSERSFKDISDKVYDFADNNDVVLLKGSHSMELEKLIPMLAKE